MWLNVISAKFKSDGVDAIRYESFFMFFHLRNVLKYILHFLDDRGCIIEGT